MTLTTINGQNAILLSTTAATTQQQEMTQQQQQDAQLKSKLLIGEFVVLNQNYSHSQVHRSLLADNLIKLVSGATNDCNKKKH